MRRSFGRAVAALLRDTRLLGVADAALFLRSILKMQDRHPEPFPGTQDVWVARK